VSLGTQTKDFVVFPITMTDEIVIVQGILRLPSGYVDEGQTFGKKVTESLWPMGYTPTELIALSFDPLFDPRTGKLYWPILARGTKPNPLVNPNPHVRLVPLQEWFRMVDAKQVRDSVSVEVTRIIRRRREEGLV
jgi:hypothetical protein